jgi:hypothetical protein
VSFLDCYDLASTVRSLSDAIGTEPVELRRALEDFDESCFVRATEDPWRLMPRELLLGLGGDVDGVVGRLEGAYYFHGTRAVDPDTFRLRGILPLDQMLEELWATLRELAADDTSDEEWAAFRSSVESDAGEHSGLLYRMKAGGRIHHGPFGLVVRETFLDPGSAGSHDYLGCPEIVQDIAACFAPNHGVNLEARFRVATSSCIVKFRASPTTSGTIIAALWYAYAKLREGRITSSANYSFDGRGEAVLAVDVVGVEVVEGI